MRHASLLARARHVELEEDDVSVLHHVLLALLPVLAPRLDRVLIAQLLQVRVPAAARWARRRTSLKSRLGRAHSSDRPREGRARTRARSGALTS